MNDNLQQMLRKLTENVTNQTKLIEQQNQMLGQHGNLLKIHTNKLQNIQKRLGVLENKETPSSSRKTSSIINTNYQQQNYQCQRNYNNRPQMNHWYNGHCSRCGNSCQQCICFKNKNKSSWYQGQCTRCGKKCNKCICY